MEIVVLISVSLGLMLVGLALSWGKARDLSSQSVVIGRVLFLVGVFAAVVILSGVAWVITIVVLLAMIGRHQSAERRSLLWMLMLAAEREIPLETAARAFASERNDRIGRRALELVEYLEAGLPLALALKRARLRFPHSVLLAAELGQQTGDLGGALRRILGRTDESETVARAATEKLLYIVFLVLSILPMWVFIMWWIVPRIQSIHLDFGIELPWATRCLIVLANAVTAFWPIVLPVVVVLLMCLWRMLAYYTGFSSRYMPGMSSSWRADRSVIMQWLAHAVRQNRPLPEMMRLISGYLTRRRLRRKLDWAARRIEQGDDWTTCLRKAGLIRRSEGAVFRSAELTGNLAWAIEEMAQSSVRRSAYRLRAVINVAFPAAVIAIGGCVLLVALGMVNPLIQLIGGIG